MPTSFTLFTKGHPDEQTLKIDRSGLGGYFAHTAVVHEKGVAACTQLVHARTLILDIGTALATCIGMAKSSPSLDTPLSDHLQKLAAFEQQGAPVVSLYLNLAPDQRGRDNYEAFCRKAFADQLRAFKEDAPDHASLVRDFERITAYLTTDVQPSANGLAIFSSAGAGDVLRSGSAGRADRRSLAVHQPRATPVSARTAD